MKLSKNLGRIATTFLATAMLAAFAAVPASAAAPDGAIQTAEGETGLTKITFTEQLVLPKEVVTPTPTFTFNIKPVTVEEGTVNIGIETDATVAVHSGKGDEISDAGTVTISKDAQRNDYTGVDGVQYVTATVDLTSLPATTLFNDAGVYKYQIVQNQLTTDASDYSDKTTALDLYLAVARKNDGSGYYIANAVLYKANDASDAAKTSTYTNWYKLDDDGDGNPVTKVGNITVNTTVSGAMGSHADEFTYEVTGLKANTNYDIQIDGKSSAQNLTSENNTFVLKHGQQAVIYGLDMGEYTITESEESSTKKGYTVYVNSVSDADRAETITLDADSKTGAVSFDNKRESIAPTGLVMNVAPYVLLVLVAAGAGYVFLRKREED